MVGQHGMGFVKLTKFSFSWSPLLVQHEKMDLKKKVLI